MLSEMIQPTRIRLHVSAANWEEAVRAGGELLVADGAAEARFVDAMVEAVREFGPYIVLAPGFALPHARPESGAVRTAMSLVTLKEPVPFGNPDNDPVDLLICLAALDSTQHVEALAGLSKIMMAPGVPERIRQAATAEEVHAILREHGADPA